LGRLLTATGIASDFDWLPF